MIIDFVGYFAIVSFMLSLFTGAVSIFGYRPEFIEKSTTNEMITFQREKRIAFLICITFFIVGVIAVYFLSK